MCLADEIKQSEVGRLLEQIEFEETLRSAQAAEIFTACADIVLDEWQYEFVTATERRLLVCAGRQSGKTTCASLKALLVASQQPRSDVLIVAPTARQSSELLRRTKAFLGHAEDILPDTIREAVTLAEFENGSRVIGLPGKADTIRGYSPACVIIDEAAFVSADVFTSVSPMLAVTGGQLILISSAGLSEGFFFEAFSFSNAWRKWSITAADNPRISDEFLESEQEVLDFDKFRAEYFNEFISTANTRVFSDEDIDFMRRNTVAPRIQRDRSMVYV